MTTRASARRHPRAGAARAAPAARTWALAALPDRTSAARVGRAAAGRGGVAGDRNRAAALAVADTVPARVAPRARPRHRLPRRTRLRRDVLCERNRRSSGAALAWAAAPPPAVDRRPPPIRALPGRSWAIMPAPTAGAGSPTAPRAGSPAAMAAD